METPLIFSTITGNAFKLAEAVKPYIPNAIGPYNLHGLRDDCRVQDTFVICYWNYRSGVDPDTLDFLNSQKKKRILLLGTMGADPLKNDYYKKVDEKVREQVEQSGNTMLGHFMCRGAIDLVRTSKKLLLPEGERGHMTPERFEEQKKSLGHPNKEDLDNAIIFVKDIFK